MIIAPARIEELWDNYNFEVADDMNAYDTDSYWYDVEYRKRELEIRERYPFEEWLNT